MRKSLKQLAAEVEYYLNIKILIRGNRAAHYAPEVHQAFWLTRSDLAYAETCARLYGDRDAYSHWCNVVGTPMSTLTCRKLFGREAMTTKFEEAHMYACHRAVTEMYDGTGLSAWDYLGDDYCGLIAEEFLTLLRNQELNDADRWAALQKYVYECAERVRDNHIDKFEPGAHLDYVAEAE